MLENLFQSLKATKRLPTPPGVALRILQLVQSDDVSLEEITNVISTDPALVAKILKYISSPAFGLGLSGATLPDAVGRIGTRGVQMLALSFSLVSQQHRQSCPSFHFDRHWSRSLARAVAARQLARTTRSWDADEAFITGLVCHIGQLIFATALPAEYEPVLRGTVFPELPLPARETKVFGADHFTVGMALLKDWQLPVAVWHNTGALSSAHASEAMEQNTSLLHLAEAIAGFLSIEERQVFSVVNDLVARAHAALGIEAEDFRALLGRVGEEWMTLGRMLSVATGQPPDLMAIEREAEEHRTALRLAAEMEINNLRAENEQLSKIAHRDRLTGMHNRRAFDDALPAALQEARKQGVPCALLLADLDHFKQVNDTHGHPMGDAVLRHVACVLNDQLRAKERAFRIGGEEFAILVPECARDDALALAEKVRAAVAAAPCEENGRKVAITVSLGLAWAHWPDRPAEAADLIDVADQRLYDAKRTGRNRCCAEAPTALGSRERATASSTAAVEAAPATSGGFLKKLGRLMPAGRK